MSPTAFRNLFNPFLFCVCCWISACGGGGGTSEQIPPPVSPLLLSPGSITIDGGTSQKFVANGGEPPYTYSVATGSGAIDGTGIYTAAVSSGNATIRVSDTAGATTTAVVNINPELALSAPSITLTASSSQTFQFSGQGGSGGYQYSLSSGSGSVDPNGVYTAGTVAGSDVLQVRDSLGTVSTGTVHLLRVRTNGIVNSAVTNGSSTYLGGMFTALNPFLTSRLAALDPTTGKPRLQCDLGRGFDDVVRATLMVGTSIYVAGDFTMYNGQPAQRLAKLAVATCALDTNFTQSIGFAGTWNPDSPSTHSTVYALSTDGTSLFIGGSFASYRGMPADCLAKVDLQSGVLDQTFTPASGTDSPVVSLIAVNDGVFVLTSRQYQYRGASPGWPVKVDIHTGEILPLFQPPPEGGEVPPAVGLVSTMILGGQSLYVAYTGVGNTSLLEKLDIATGAEDPAFQNQWPNTEPFTTLALSGNSLYAYGPYSFLKIDATTGLSDASFAPPQASFGLVNALSVQGSSLYAVGYQQQPPLLTAAAVWKLDTNTGVVDGNFGLNPGFSWGTASSVLATAEAVYVGGSMATYGGTPSRYLARFNSQDGTADATFMSNSGPNNIVTKLLLSGSSLYVGGKFSQYGNLPAGALAKVDTTTGLPDPQFTRGSAFTGSPSPTVDADPLVYSIVLQDNSLYVGGFFTTYRGQPAELLAKLDATTGDLDTTFTQPQGFSYSTFSPVYISKQVVATLAITPGALYVGGTFDTYRGTSINLLAKLDPVTGVLDPAFAPVPSAYLTSEEYLLGAEALSTLVPNGASTITSLLVSGNSLYVGGAPLTLSASVPSSGLAKLDATTGAPDTAFTQSVTLYVNGLQEPYVHDLAMSGTSLYVGGDFALDLQPYSSPGTPYAVNLVKIDATTGTADLTFNLPDGPDLNVNSITSTGNSLLINGAFDTYRTVAAPFSLTLDPLTGANLDNP
jgi:Domain of unknown function (DUF5122) beta-propeller